jgi:hypothetical protein
MLQQQQQQQQQQQDFSQQPPYPSPVMAAALGGGFAQQVAPARTQERARLAILHALEDEGGGAASGASQSTAADALTAAYAGTAGVAPAGAGPVARAMAALGVPVDASQTSRSFAAHAAALRSGGGAAAPC